MGFGGLKWVSPFLDEFSPGSGLSGGCSPSAPAPTVGSPSPRWPRAVRSRGSAPLWRWPQLCPSPGGGTRGWTLMGTWRRRQGHPFLSWCRFMMDQISSETISSIFCWCPIFYKTSVFCPKSPVFLKVLMCLEMEATASLLVHAVGS